MKARNKYFAIGLFYIIAVLCRYVGAKTDFLKDIDNGYLHILLLGIGPTLGALITFVVFRIPTNLSLKGTYATIWIPLIVYTIFPALLIATVYYVQEGNFPLLLMFTVLLYGLLEEIGWRGFLQEQLAKLPIIYANLLIAILWFVWHLNFAWNTGNIIFFFIILAGTWGIGKVYKKTHSLLAVAGFHSLNNFFRNGIHGTEITLIVILLTVWVGFMIWSKRKGKSQEIQEIG
ncbi:CPBP family intramembrane glutamic endopeptidase [Sphingobacterium sp. LRF_L2]|uniref:CPBP family intramembrane glutamic endopeptidase n=1 Tax=Sphingobacterium sp. LRF_L2 TaxID=3369421 RepID=UPI003F5D883F